MELGKHLILDCFGCTCLDDKEFIRRFLQELVEKLNMSKIYDPVLVDYKHKDEEKSGITGFILISESHLSVHTYPKKSYVAIDIFSCKNFDVDMVITYVKKKFNAKRIIKNVIRRGYGL